MAKVISTDVHDTIDPVASREERKATGRMVALFVALLLILLVMYHAWIRKTPVLAGIMVPALIMLLYAAGVLFLAKRDKQRRIIAENNLRDLALSELAASTTLTNASSTKNLTSVKVENPSTKVSHNYKTSSAVNTTRKTTPHQSNQSLSSTKKTVLPHKLDDEKLKLFEKSCSKYKIVNECAKPREQSALARSLSAT